ncbi:guanylate-binding protein 6-like [Pipistrellus kuhlii]|uniref:guanylate-binding protein 6-like n=1 Tax=Pipistrellus kuhlii TaxID=59472 RepID=UPI00174F6C11|nr:guanylate-binding protein 6-like [Pipistrellus kuhlii]
MASKSNMMAPVCLVENNNEHLSVNQEALEFLDQISQPVVVVAIAGPYRTGKSYLMNQLAGQNHGFPLGSTVQSETKGIWMWCVPHPSKPDCTLVLLDTEGLGDVEKGDPKDDLWIFALAVLLSSMFVYNSLSTINHQALEQLHYVTELTELIRAKSSLTPDGIEDSAEFVSFFPDFIWAVRDFSLELELNGLPITEDEYLENSLKLIPGMNHKAQISNLPRECIRNFFPRRKCFVFDRPTNDKKLLANIEKVADNQLDPNFKEETKNFCSYIFTQARTKTLREGIMINGKRLKTLVETYVTAINNGLVPCLENAMTTLAQIENSRAIQKAADHYSKQMAQRVSFPTDTLQELLDLHAACEREAIAIFMENSFKDENQVFLKDLVKIIKDKQNEFLLQNEDASVKYCQDTLKQLSKPLMEGISAGMFSVPGGHKLYMETKGKIEQDYCQVSKKGVKANEVLYRFLQSLAATENSILQADKALTDGEKAIAVEQAKKEAAEKEQELKKQELQEQEQQMEAHRRSREENILQLTEKIEKENEIIIREQNMMLEHKLKVQEDLLREGFKKKSEDMNVEINHLRNIIDSSKSDNSPYITKIMDRLASEIDSIFCTSGKFFGNVLRRFGSLFKDQ